MENFKAHILVVDDDDGIRDLVKEFLNRNQYLVRMLLKKLKLSNLALLF